MAKVEEKVARKYARALFELYTQDTLEVVSAALNTAAKIWQTNDELRTTLRNPSFNVKERAAAAQEVAEAIKPGDKNFANFLALLVENGRITALPMVATIFARMVAELRKILTLEVTSAFPLSEEERTSILERIKSEHGILATIAWQVDQDLIGGLKIQSGDRLYDRSIRSAMNQIEQQLLH